MHLLLDHTLLGVKAYRTVSLGEAARDVTSPIVILNDSSSISKLAELMVAEYCGLEYYVYHTESTSVTICMQPPAY